MFSSKNRKKFREYWKTMLASTHCKMNRGAEYLKSVITCAHKSQWRRNNHRDK
jgi:hypothetical protein